MNFKIAKIKTFRSKILISYNINTYLLIFSILFSSLDLNAQKNNFILTLDAGHGGRDNGAVYNGLKEKDITLAIALKLGKKIETEQLDVKVIHTRTDDSYPELYKRAEIANLNKSNLFISIHCNSSEKLTGLAIGTETWVLGTKTDKRDDNFDVVTKENNVIFLEKNYKKNYDGYNPKLPESVIGMTLMQDKFLENSLRFAQIIEKTFQIKENRLSRGVKQGLLLVLVKTAMPAVLIEVGFINHPHESSYLASVNGQNKIVSSIYDAFVKYKEEYYKRSSIFTKKLK